MLDIVMMCLLYLIIGMLIGDYFRLATAVMREDPEAIYRTAVEIILEMVIIVCICML